MNCRHEIVIDGCATGQPQGLESEAYLNSTSQGSWSEDAREAGHIRDRSRLFMAYVGYISTDKWNWSKEIWPARIYHELSSGDREDGRATRRPQGVGPEAYLNGTSQGSTPEDAWKASHILGRSRRFMVCPG
jgi:hypothetical protein